MVPCRATSWPTTFGISLFLSFFIVGKLTDRLEVLPSTLAVPEIHGKSTYLTLSRVVTWSVLTLFPGAVLVVESFTVLPRSKPVVLVRFSIQSSSLPVDLKSKRRQDTMTTGLSHFHIDLDSGLIVRHVYEVKDASSSTTTLADRSTLVDWILGRRGRRGELLPQMSNMKQKSS